MTEHDIEKIRAAVSAPISQVRASLKFATDAIGGCDCGSCSRNREHATVLTAAIDELEALRRNETLAANYAEKEQERARDIFALTEQVAALKTQLAAALNDAARAELRARDLAGLADASDGLERADGSGVQFRRFQNAIADAREALAAEPDSDARLREVMGKAFDETVSTFGVNKSVGEREIGEIRARIIDEVLGVKP